MVDDVEMEEILSSERGKSPSYLSSLIHNEKFQPEAREFVREHAYKGEPNLTIQDFKDWIKDTYNTSVHNETARTWLHKLGFSQVHHQKGVYFDGHDRDDVVAYRQDFLKQLELLDKKTIKYDGITPDLPPGETCHTRTSLLWRLMKWRSFISLWRASVS